MDWTSGYVTELDYPHGYFRELAPASISLAATFAGTGTSIGERPLRYLELGCGQGLSVNIHAAACEGEFWGADFNPNHARNAQLLAGASGGNARMLDASFQELLDEHDLPEFDVIALHGTWSWVSAENRAAIVEIARRHLGVGGVMYISYNTLPGWAADMPVRHLMTMHASRAGGPGSSMASRIDAAMDFAGRIAGTDRGYFKGVPSSQAWLKTLRSHSRNYLAHEYFNRDWHPMYFSEVAEALAEAKLSFAGTATLMEGVREELLPKETVEMLKAMPDPIMRQTALDFVHNQRFRRDLFVRGAQRLSVASRNERLLASRYVLSLPHEDVPMKVKYSGIQLDLQANIYKPLIEAFGSGQGGPRTLQEVHASEACRKLPVSQVLQAIQVLCGAGHLHLAQAPAAIQRAAPRCKGLNDRLLRNARDFGDVEALASPVLGGGVHVPRMEMMFLLARQLGQSRPAEWAQFAVNALNAQGQRIVKDGKAISSDAEALKELSGQAGVFEKKRLPILKTLGVA